jgi:hypothetical protein
VCCGGEIKNFTITNEAKWLVFTTIEASTHDDKYDISWAAACHKRHFSYSPCDHNVYRGIVERHAPYLSELTITSMGVLKERLGGVSYVKLKKAPNDIVTSVYIIEICKIFTWLTPKVCEDILDTIANRIGQVNPLTFDELLEDRPKCRKNQCRKSIEAYKQGQFKESDSKCFAFVKNERMTKTSKPPRLIQARAPLWTTVWQLYIRAIEIAMSNMAVPITNKGMNADGTYDLINELYDQGDCSLLLDHDAFDSSVNYFILQLVHKVYSKICPNDQFKRMMKEQLINRVRNLRNSRMRWTVVGTRMSGDGDTASGNTMANWIFLEFLLHGITMKPVICGDDSAVMFQKCHVQEVKDRIDKVNGTIFRMKYKIVDQFENIDFCQSMPCTINKTMLKDASRTVSRGMLCIAKVRNAIEFKEWMKCYYLSNRQYIPLGLQYLEKYCKLDKFVNLRRFGEKYRHDMISKRIQYTTTAAGYSDGICRITTDGFNYPELTSTILNFHEDEGWFQVMADTIGGL